MNLHLGLKSKVCFSLLLVLSFVNAYAQDENSGLVEVQHYQDNLAPYKERRGDNGFYFGVTYEPVVFKNYVSFLDGLTYGDMFGSSTIPMINVSFEYKRNMAMGSISGGFIYGGGQISGDGSGEKRTLSISKIGLDFRYTMDMLLDEPYAAPYVSYSMWKMGITEESPSDKFNANTQIGYSYSVGVLLQLDWIDYEVAKKATFDYGLENTFVDVYATQYAKTQAADDPNTSTDFTYGAGLRMEF